MNDRQKTEPARLDTPPHPTAGWIVVAPFPRPEAVS